MSDAPRHPAGWYPDPANPAVLRWWDGLRWTEATQQPQPEPPAAVTPSEPAPAAAVQPVAPPADPALPQYPVGYPATAAGDASEPALRRDIPTGTVWIWLVVLLPLLSLATVFLLDWRGFVEDLVIESMSPGAGMQTWALSWSVGSLAITLFGYVLVAAQIVFAYLDWRVLRARGVERPFHWAWIFFALAITNGVYVIGRGVVLRRRTGTGLGPVWAWIAVTAVSWIVGIVFSVVLINDIIVLVGLIR